MLRFKPLLLFAGGAIAVLLLERHTLASRSERHTAIRDCTCCAQADARDLPLIELPAPHPQGTMAVMISGDGGWRAIDRDIAAGLNARGISVIGLSSPQFFAIRKTPDEAACALQRIIETYTIEWKQQRVIVAGDSRGAGVAPFMVNRLPPAWRAKVTSLALISLDRAIGLDGTPVRGEIEKLRGPHVLCFYSEGDSKSLCRDLAPPVAMPFRDPGYNDVARTIWEWSAS
jgi:type IV secretory pathway VirJ component